MVIFDSGGFLDKKLEPILRASTLVIVPIDFSNNTITTLSLFLEELQTLNKTIMFVCTKIENDKKFQELKEILSDMGIQNKFIFKLRKTSIFETVLEKNIGVFEAQKMVWFGSRYQNFIEEYTQILNVLTMQRHD